jgi:hypothetical protein
LLGLPLKNLQSLRLLLLMLLLLGVVEESSILEALVIVVGCWRVDFDKLWGALLLLLWIWKS